MKAYILDTSVAAKWFLPAADEPLWSDAAELLRQYSAGRSRLIVPDLFWPELGSVLLKAVRKKRISRASADDAMTSLETIGISTAPSQPLLREAFAIASLFSQSVYEGTYVALAVMSDLPLITADERLAKALGARFPVRWLGGL